MEKINTAMQNFIEWKGLTNPIDMYIIIGILFLIFIVLVKFIIDFYQESVGPNSTEGQLRYYKCPKGIQVKILVHNYGLIKTWHTFDMGTVYANEDEAFKAFMNNDRFIESTEDFLINRIFRLRMLFQIENGQI